MGAVNDKMVSGQRDTRCDRGTHVSASKLLSAMGLPASTVGPIVTGDSPRLPVPEDTPPSYAESRLDSCGQQHNVELTLLN
jgi:hypothetical protein